MASCKHQWEFLRYDPSRFLVTLNCRRCHTIKQVCQSVTIYNPGPDETQRKTTDSDYQQYNAVVADHNAKVALEKQAALAAANPEAVQAAIEGMAQVAAEREAKEAAQAEQAAEKAAKAAQDDRAITLLATENPKRPGSASFDRFALYQTGMTIAEYLKAGGQRSDIRWDSDRGFIALG